MLRPSERQRPELPRLRHVEPRSSRRRPDRRHSTARRVLRRPCALPAAAPLPALLGRRESGQRVNGVAAGRPHVIVIRRPLGTGQYIAECSCGDAGEPRTSWQAAHDDLPEHRAAQAERTGGTP